MTRDKTYRLRFLSFSVCCMIDSRRVLTQSEPLKGKICFLLWALPASYNALTGSDFHSVSGIIPCSGYTSDGSVAVSENGGTGRLLSASSLASSTRIEHRLKEAQAKQTCCHQTFSGLVDTCHDKVHNTLHRAYIDAIPFPSSDRGLGFFCAKCFAEGSACLEVFECGRGGCRFNRF